MKGKWLGEYIIILMFTLLCISCDSKQQKEIASLVEYWENREIIFPVTSVFIKDKDTIDFSLKAQYKILSYIDSTGCVSCKLKLAEWKKFINMIDSVNSSVKIIFFFSPDKVRDVYNALHESYFTYPVCIDDNDSLNKLNHLPSDMMFQTFLLDKDNKVLAIGNPIHNFKVKELYLKIIQGEKVEQMQDAEVVKTKVDINRTFISLGRFAWQKEQKATFSLKNMGNKPLVVQDVNTSCGCTSVSYSKEPVQPSGELQLEVTYKAEHPEHFNKTITVYCNAESAPLVLKIMGDAE